MLCLLCVVLIRTSKPIIKNNQTEQEMKLRCMLDDGVENKYGSREKEVTYVLQVSGI